MLFSRSTTIAREIKGLLTFKVAMSTQAVWRAYRLWRVVLENERDEGGVHDVVKVGLLGVQSQRKCAHHPTGEDEKGGLVLDTLFFEFRKVLWPLVVDTETGRALFGSQGRWLRILVGVITEEQRLFLDCLVQGKLIRLCN